MSAKMPRLQRRIRRLYVVLLTFVLAGGLVPVPAMAELADELQVMQQTNDDVQVVVEGVEMTLLPTQDNVSNDDLAAAYVEQRFAEQLPNDDIGVEVQSAADYLSGFDEKAFTYLRKEIALIASGELKNTKIEIPLSEFVDNATFTWAEVGISQPIAGGKLTEEATAAVNGVVTIDYHKVVDALLADCPYELYWFDKTAGYSHSSGFAFSATSTSFTITSNPTVAFAVASEYGSGYTMSSNVGTVVNDAVTLATQIASTHKDEPTSQRLLSYKNAICDLVDYNKPASEGGVAYGNPWQLVWVFDNDPSTKVVCEGYSKAFKYLCDLSGKKDMECILATGHMGAGTMEGHMWNVVRMPDQKNYLVDVTNCDEGSAGAPDLLFLKGYQSGSYDDYYVFTTGNEEGYLAFAYDSDTKASFPETDLTLSASDYDGSSDVGSKQEISPVVTLEGWTYGSVASTPVLAEGSNPGGGEVAFAYKAQGADDSTYTTEVPSQAGNYTVRATIAETDGYLGGSAVANFTIAKAVPPVGTVSASGAGCDLDASKVSLSRSDESVPGTLSLDADELAAGTHDYAWTFSPDDAANYERATGTVSVTAPGHQAADPVREGEAAPTCVEPGGHDEVTYCSSCGAELSREHVADAALGHDYEVTVVDPTWDAGGYTLHRCSRCGDEYRTDEVPSLRDAALEAAAPVADAIAALPGPGELALADEGDVLAARAAYDALTQEQRGLVENYAVLEAAEARIAELRAAADLADISGAAVSAEGQTYTGRALEPAVTVTLGDRELVAGTDYDVSYSNNVNAGTATVTVAGKGAYTGTATGSFAIARRPVTVRADDKSKAYGQADPELTASVEGAVGTDVVAYELSRAPGDAAGAYAITPTGAAAQGNYAVSFVPGTLTVSRAVPPVGTVSASGAGCDLDASKVSLSRTDESVPGTLSLSAARLEEGTRDYGWTFSPDDAANYERATGTVSVTAPGHDWGAPAYEWSADNASVVATRVCRNNVAHAELETVACSYSVTRDPTCARAGEGVWTSSAFKNPAFQAQSRTVAIPKADHSPADPVREGEAAPTCVDAGGHDEVTYCASCGAELSREHVDDPALGHDYEVTVVDPTWDAGGYALHRCSRCGDEYRTDEVPSLRDAALEAAAPVADAIAALPGPGELALSDEGDVLAARAAYDALTQEQRGLVENYAVLEAAEARIAELRAAADLADISGAAVSAEGQTYTGEALEPAVTVTLGDRELVAGTDYDVSYSNNVNAGTATVTVAGKGAYTGTATGSFAIAKAEQTVAASNKSVAMGKTVSLGAKASSGGTLTYKSSSTAVAKVSAKGVITPVKVGKVTITVSAAATNNHKAASKRITVSVTKGAQPMVVKVATKSAKASAVKKGVVAVAPITVSKAQGKVTYARVAKGSSAALTVNAKTGKVTIKKGTKKGSYKVKVKVSAAGNTNWNAGSKTVACTVKVK